MRARSGGFLGVFDMMISVLTIRVAYTRNVATDDDLLLLENQLCFSIVTAARNVVSIYRPILAPLGLTHPQYLVMLALWERSPRALHDLAHELALEPASASPLVKRLERDGLVERTRSAEDERRLEIGLTENGRALRARAAEVPKAVMASIGIDLHAVSTLREALKPFASAVPVGD